MALEWEEVTTSMIGTPCSAVYGVPTINIYLNSENELAASGTSIPFSVIMNTSAYTIQSSPIGALLFFLQLRHLDLLPNTTYFWRTGLSNGREWAFSDVWFFRTRERDCSGVPCVQGTCDETTLACECNYDWSGPDCSIPPPESEYTAWFIISYF